MRSNASLLIIAAATLSIAIFPVPVCFDCEPSYSWGQSAAVASRNGLVFAIWLIATPFLAGIFKLRKAWLVPIGLTAGHIATQHLGGVPWWDVKANEGPVIVLFELPVAFVSLIAGIVINILWTWYRDNRADRRIA